MTSTIQGTTHYKRKQPISRQHNS